MSMQILIKMCIRDSRWGNPNYDCSGLVIRSLEEAGILAKSSGATYTGNMPEVLPKIGFKDVVKSVDLATGSGMIRGDVLLGNGHTAFYLSLSLIHI